MLFFAEVAQLVEHQLPKLEVAGSSPVFRCLGAWPSGLRRGPAKPIFVGSNPTAPFCFKLKKKGGLAQLDRALD